MEGDLDDLLRARGGDDAAARQLLLAHGTALLRVAGRVLGPAGDADAADAVQEALVAALVTDALPHGDVGAWLRAIVARKALDLARARGRRREQALPAEDPAAPPPAFIDHVAVRKALIELSAADRAVLVLVDVEGFSMKEAAAALESTAIAVKLRAMRARRKLAKALGAVPKEKTP